MNRKLKEEGTMTIKGRLLEGRKDQTSNSEEILKVAICFLLLKVQMENCDYPIFGIIIINKVKENKILIYGFGEKYGGTVGESQSIQIDYIDIERVKEILKKEGFKPRNRKINEYVLYLDE